MNLQTINSIRATAGLKPLQADPNKQAKHKRQAANKAARGQASRDLKSQRSKGGK